MKTKKLLALLLTLVMLVGLLPAVALAALSDGNIAIGTLTFTDKKGVSHEASPKVLGETKYTQGTLEFDATVYLAELPFGATVTDYTKTAGSNMAQVIHSSMAASTNATAFATALTANDSYLDGTYLPSGEGLASNSQYKTQIVPVLNTEGIRTGIPNANVKGFAIKELTMTAKTAAVLIVTIENSSINRDALDNEIAKVWNVENNTYTNNYYTETDRWNGTKAYPLDKNNPTRGFFWDATEKDGNPLTTALGDFSNQTEVDAAAEALSSAILDLIPSEQANTTLLYEALHAKWYWAYSVYERVPKEWTEIHQGNPEWVNADSTTYASWMPYASALDDAQEMMDTLFDADGKATESNKASLNTQIAALVAALDVSKLVNKENYTQNYNYFLEHEATVETLLTQSDPTGLDQESYTSASWRKLVDAWNALEGDLDHRFKGGSREDMDILIAFPSHLDSLQKAYQGLVSDTDITVNFTYVNNFAAKYPALRNSGQDILQMDSLPLANGHTTVRDAVTAAFVQFDSTDIRGFVIPGDINNTSDTSPVYLVYVNGKYMGNSTQTIQLHDHDDVRVVRICEPVYVTEVSTGQSSSSNLENLTLDTTYLGDSLATIAMTAPEAPKVGDKAAFSATLTGAYGSNVGDARSAGNITLFVSEPYTDETEHFTHQPTTNTGVSTDVSGKLEYVFSEPGWYAVAMFNVEDDTPTFTDIYDSTTEGVYPSVYAGDFTFVYVAPSEDEAKLIAQYKAEYAETAKAYFDGFHDYDFADGYYADTFKPQYDALVEHLESALSYKALKEQFEADFALLKEYGATAIDHQGLVNALRQKLGYLPDDLATLNSGNAALVTEIQTAYASLNDHTKTLLTPEEIARLNAIAAIDVAALPAAAVTVNIQTIGTLPSKSGNGNPYYGYPNLTWVKTPNLDGTVDYPVWATTYDTAILNAKAGDHVFVRRYLNSTDAQYRLVWTVDDGTTWTSSLPQTLVTPDGVVYDGYYLVEYIVPQDVASGSTVTIQLKMWSKAEYDANGLAATKESALAAVQAAYDSYDLSKYDADGQAALLTALNKGKEDIGKAETNDAVAQARKAAVAAMKAVRKADDEQKPNTFDAGAAVGSVHVLIENTTYDGLFYRPTYGVIAEADHVLSENDSMMTVVLEVLEENGFTWNGTTGNQGDGGAAADYTITYLASIHKDGESLGEFDGNAKSGWMGTLNDWFVSEGFEAFTVANGKLESGDEIHVMFTMNLGADIGGTWGNNNTALATMDVTGGKLTPAFDGATTSYTLIVPAGGASVTVYPVPVNKNYQTRIFLNDYNKDAAQYKRTDVIAVKPGDVLYVGVGEKGWPTMNSGGKPTKYTIQVETADSAADKLDADKIKLSNYAEYEAILAGIDRSSLSDAGKAKYDAVQEKVTFYTEIEAVKAQLAVLPKSDKTADAQVLAAKDAINAAYEAYKALSEEQQDYITVGDAANYNALVTRLFALTPEEPGTDEPGTDEPAQDKPGPQIISGSTAAPETPATVVENADGSKVETVTETATERTENADGSVTETVREKTTEKITDAEGNVTKTVTEAKTETTTGTVENADGSVTETTGTVEKVTETVTAADGTKTTVVTETEETRQVSTTVGEDGKVSGAGTVSATSTVTDENGNVLSTAVTEGTVAVDTDEQGTVSAVTTATTTTTDAEGNVTETVTVTTEAEMTDGTTAKVVADGEGNTLSAEAEISEAALNAALESGEPIRVPATVRPTDDPEKAAPVRITLPELATAPANIAEMPRVEIEVSQSGSGVVAFEKQPDGTMKLVQECRIGSVIVPVSGSCELVIVDNSKSFSDVSAAAWYGDSVDYVTAREVFNGMGDGTFAPGEKMNRAMAAQILYNFDRSAEAGDGSSFKDVSAEDWFSGAVGWAAANGIIVGYDGGYAPTANITRQDLVTVLWRYMKTVGYDVEGAEADLLAYADGEKVSDYAAEAMRWAISTGVITGYPDGTLHPRSTATRAEVAAIMQRVIEKAMK